HRSGASDHAEVSDKPRRPADGSVRPDSRGRGRGSVAVLQRSRRPVLRSEQAWGEGLTGHPGSVLALEHAGWSQRRGRQRQSLFRNGLHRGPQKVRYPDSGHARRRRSDRSGEGLCEEIGPADQGCERDLLSGGATRPHGDPSGPSEYGSVGLPQERRQNRSCLTSGTPAPCGEAWARALASPQLCWSKALILLDFEGEALPLFVLPNVQKLTRVDSVTPSSQSH